MTSASKLFSVFLESSDPALLNVDKPIDEVTEQGTVKVFFTGVADKLLHDNI